MNIIVKPFAMLLLFLYNFVGNYGWAVILFAVIVKVILLPFQMKSKKSMMRMSRLNPKMQELQQKFGDDKQKYNIEMQKLYKEQGVSPLSGCLWSLIPFPILIALYAAVRQPLTKLMELTAEQVTALTDFFNGMGYTIASTGRQAAYVELELTSYIHDNFAAAQAIVPEVQDFNLHFLGLNLGEVPNWKFFTVVDWSNFSDWAPALGLFLIPIVSAALSYLSMKVSTDMNPQTSAAAGSTNKTMMLMMPAMSIWICFIMPGVMGIYWIANSVLAIIQDVILTRIYKRKLDIEDADRLAAQREKDALLEQKRRETEALRAEGATKQNENTSKKKLQAAQKAKEDERRAAEAAAKKAERRRMLGIEEAEIPPSQEGNRRYARGRAYVPDRFTNPEGFEEAAPDDESYVTPDYSAEDEAILSGAAEAPELEAADGEPAAEPVRELADGNDDAGEAADIQETEND